jgi:trigger factor
MNTTPSSHDDNDLPVSDVDDQQVEQPAADDPQAGDAQTGQQQADEGGEEGEEVQEKLSLDITVDSPSACERHVTVVVSREDIDKAFQREFDELVPKAEVPGFRPGRAPRKLVVNRFKEQIADQVKGKLLMDSMAQVNDEHEFSAISEPDLDLGAINLPDEGPMTFEFTLEVRPEFELPEWKGLDLQVPTHEITDAEVDVHLKRILNRYAKLVEHSGPAAADDLLTVNITFRRDGEVLSTIQEVDVPLRSKLSLRDAELENFGELLTGAAEGDRRQTKVTVSQEAEAEALKGQEVDAEIEVVAVQKRETPQLTHAFLDEIGGFQDEAELRDAVREELVRQDRYRQQQAIRRQITQQLTADATWELPPTLLKRQARRELQRFVLELRSAGFGEDVIQAHANQLQRNSMAHTAVALKEHFILERIAEEESIDAEPDDYDTEIELIAEQSGLPPRRVRARLEKRGEMDSLRNQIVERKVIELITSHAGVTEVPEEPQIDDEAALDHAVSGVGDREQIPEAKHGEEPKPLPGTPS